MIQNIITKSKIKTSFQKKKLFQKVFSYNSNYSAFDYINQSMDIDYKYSK